MQTHRLYTVIFCFGLHKRYIIDQLNDTQQYIAEKGKPRIQMILNKSSDFIYELTY
jgi:hypothetical protein